MGMSGMGMSGMGAMMVLWGVVLLVVVALAVVGIVLLLRRGAGEHGSPADASPDEILRRRYALGEVDDDEFSRRQAGLKA